jgi:hypothetical protein
MTQTQQVLRLLRLRGDRGLTPIDALREVGSFRLAARISEAKELIDPEEEIVTERLTVGDATVARYVLRRRTTRDAVQSTIWTETRP